MVDLTNVWARDFNTAGIPSSGVKQPEKSKIREWGTYIESLTMAASYGNTVWFATKALLDADLAHAAGVPAIVYADTTAANNGIYIKAGASGAGSWGQIITYLPGYQFVTATDAGAGTANAIVATSSPRVAYTDGVQIIRLNIFETTTSGTVTVAFDGGAALTIQTASGNAPASGGLIAGMTILGIVDQSASVFRMLSDQSTAALLTQTEAAAAEAVAAVAAVNALIDDGYTVVGSEPPHTKWVLYGGVYYAKPWFVMAFAGQSNAAGSSGTYPAVTGDKTQHADVFSYAAATGLQQAALGDYPFNVATVTGGPVNNAFFHLAKRIADELDQPVLIVGSAQGGLSIDEWITVANGGNDTKWTGTIIANLTAAFALPEWYGTSKLDLFCWHQGETDYQKPLEWYDAKFDLLCSQVRALPGASANTPVVAGEMFYSQGTASDAQNTGYRRRLWRCEDPYFALSSAYGLAGQADDLHFSGASLVEMGNSRYWAAYKQIPTGLSPALPRSDNFVPNLLINADFSQTQIDWTHGDAIAAAAGGPVRWRGGSGGGGVTVSGETVTVSGRVTQVIEKINWGGQTAFSNRHMSLTVEDVTTNNLVVNVGTDRTFTFEPMTGPQTIVFQLADYAVDTIYFIIDTVAGGGNVSFKRLRMGLTRDPMPWNPDSATEDQLRDRYYYELGNNTDSARIAFGNFQTTTLAKFAVKLPRPMATNAALSFHDTMANACKLLSTTGVSLAITSLYGAVYGDIADITVVTSVAQTAGSSASLASSAAAGCIFFRAEPT